jgi:hypothetical protein
MPFYSSNYEDVIYRSAGKGALERIDVLYHSAIRFSTNAPYRTHHRTLYSSVNWSSLCTLRKTHWLIQTCMKFDLKSRTFALVFLQAGGGVCSC